jgi:hypothetical protein
MQLTIGEGAFLGRVGIARRESKIVWSKTVGNKYRRLIVIRSCG